MDFDLTDEQRLVQKNVHQFMRKEIEPIAEQIDREDRFPVDIWKKMGELGVLGVTIPEEYGGSGFDLLTAVLVIEQIARTCPALAVSYGAHANLCADNLSRNGTEEQKRKYLPGLCSGDLVGCLALTEPNSGSDAISIRTTAIRDGDDFILNGTKMFITNAPVGDVFLTYAKTDRDSPAKSGITTFIVEKDFPGFQVSRALEKMGNRGSPTGEIVFEDCRVPRENVIGVIGAGIRVMMGGLDVERAFFSGEPLGLAEGALELARKYSMEREQFGKPICNFQLIKAKLADMYTEIEAARGLVYRAATLADKIERGGKGTEVHKIAASAMLFAAETATRVVNQALQIHGGYGYMLEFPINRFYRDAKLYEIGAGTSEIRRLVIADEIIQRGLEYV
ncbi:MAG: acyl-CoA dehydrogenase family protein [Deltaproteobacteria bacterium]|nr:acyl-CoA dehydrogenase family protein [Deltaproteobacteria bacterium]